MNEDELCKWFIEEEAKPNGWVCYPETSDWDILLVRNGIQIGVQAKVRANVKLIQQVLPLAPSFRYGSIMSAPEKYRGHLKGPDFRTILVPEEGIGKKTFGVLSDVCRICGIWMFAKGKPRRWGGEPHHLGTALLEDPEEFEHYDWHPPEKEWFPEVVPDLPAGVKSPVQLTRWKQQALKLIARAEVRGYVTSKDAKELDINFQRFKDGWKPWMEFCGKEGRIHRYSLCGDDPKRPDRQCPEAYKHFLEEEKGESENNSD